MSINKTEYNLKSGNYMQGSSENEVLCELNIKSMFKEISKYRFSGTKEKNNKKLKILLIYKTINLVRRKLKTYKNIKTLDLVNMCSLQFNSFYENTITVKDLYKIKSRVNSSLLRNKLHNVSLIFKVYNLVLHNSKIEHPNKCLVALRYLKKNNIFKNFTLTLNNLNFFNKSEGLVFKKALAQSKRLCVTLEPNSDNCKCDSPNNLWLKSILEFAQNSKVKVDFKHDKNQFNKESYNYEAVSLHDELNFVCQTIKKYILENIYEEDDILVFVKSAKDYLPYITQYLDDYEVNYSLMCKEKNKTPFIKTILLLLELIVNNNFETEIVLNYAKAGLLNVTDEDIFKLEIYAKTYDISPDEWLNEFKRCKNTDQKYKYLSELNNIREKIINPVLEFKEKLNNSSGVKEKIKKLCSFVYSAGIERNFKNLIFKLNKKRLKHLVNEQINAWKTVKSIFEYMVLVLNEDKVSSKDFYDLFKELIKTEPIVEKKHETIGSVKVINNLDYFENFKNKIKVIFIVGAIDGSFPKIVNNSCGFFSINELKIIQNLGYMLEENTATIIKKENLNFKKVLNIAKEKVYFTYPKFSLNGEKLNPAWFVKNSKAIKNPNNCTEILSRDSAFRLYAKSLKQEITLNKVLGAYFKNSPDYEERVNILKNYCSKDTQYIFKQTKNIVSFFNKTTETGTNITLSPSQIEEYYSCAFKFLCKYMFNLSKVKTESFDNLKYGDLIHCALEKIFKAYTSAEILNIDDESLKVITLEMLEKYLHDELGFLNLNEQRLKFLLKRATSVLVFAIKYIASELVNSEFIPKFFELKIGKDIKNLEINTESLGIVNITGKVDRLDVFKTTELNKEVNYIRIIDYKTGAKELKLLDVLYGQNLQMLLYMLCVLKNIESLGYINPEFAGVLYVPVKNKTVLLNKKGLHSKEEITLQKLKKLRMNGLILNNLAVADAMEKDIKGNYIPVTLKDNNKLKGTGDSLLDENQIKIILDYVEYLVKNMAFNINKGSFTPNPLKGNKCDSCQYCEYQSVCGINYSKNLEITIENMDTDEIYNKMSENLTLDEFQIYETK